MKYTRILALPLTLSLLLAACSEQNSPVVTGPEQPPVITEPTTPPVVTEPVKTVATSDLRISEISTSYFSDSAAWMEVYNGTGKAINLKDYQVRAYSSQRVAPYDDELKPRSYPLPDLMIEPGEYILIGGQGVSTFADNISKEAKQIYVHDGDWIPNWYDSGFVELTSQSATVDMVRFGDNTAEPLTPGAWKGANALPLQIGENRYGRALSRALNLADTDAASDWTANAWLTPFGPNNIAPLAADLDLDGIPDMAEAPGMKYGALDVYALGARAGVRDLFLEIDYMPSQDQATTPLEAALDKLVKVFAARNIAVHIDTGTLYGNKYNLGGGNAVAFQACTTIEPTKEQAAGGCSEIYSIKAKNQSALRRNLFHYVLFANSQQVDGKAGSSGYAEINGNDLIVTLGDFGFDGLALDDLSLNRRNLLVNFQAGTLMHELGHNLGLRHGGFENGPNYKPNYLSIMNYAYQLNGLPQTFNQKGAELPWAYNAGKVTREKLGVFNRCDLPGGPCSDNFKMDYSDGSSAVLNENALDERGGLGRGAFDVDWNFDGVIDAKPVKFDVTFDRDNSGNPKPVYSAPLRDWDDWGNLTLSFTRYWSGNNNGVTTLNATRPTSAPTAQQMHDDHADEVAVPLFDALQSDRQQTAAEQAPSAELLEFLRTVR